MKRKITMMPSKIPMLILSAIIGGCALVGLFTLLLVAFALTQGAVNPTWVPLFLFGLFTLGAAGSAGGLWLALRRLEKNVTEKIIQGFGLDK
jgi:hypothetical protein